MLEASAFQALQAQAPYRGIIKPPVELVVHDLDSGRRCIWKLQVKKLFSCVKQDEYLKIHTKQEKNRMKSQSNWTKHEIQKGGRLQRPLFWQSLEPPSLPEIIVCCFAASGIIAADAFPAL